MQESLPYREELSRYATLFAARRKRQLWRDDSLARLERALFVGFLFVRKLIECRKVTDACARSSTTIGRAPINRARLVSDFQRDDLVDDLIHVEWTMGKVDVHQLADKVIHSWWILPARDEGRGLAGFIFTTDRQRNAELWFLPTDSVAKVFRTFGRAAINSLHKRRDPEGRLIYWEAK
jgi:hypothetical protein